MAKIPKGGLVGRTVRLVRKAAALRIPLHAAGAGYFMILSLFPALVLLLRLLRETGLQVEHLVELVRGWIPEALVPAAEEIIVSAYANSSGALVGLAGFLTEAVDLRFWLLLILQSAVFALMFTVLPNRRGRFRESLPGALLASLGWLVFSDMYSFYVDHFAGLRSIYGSVYAIALSMLWLYCCMSIVFYGGALNRFLEGT